MGQLLDNRLVAMDLLAQGLDGLPHRLDGHTQRVDLMVERLDTLHQLRRQGAQLFRGQVIEIGKRSHGADFARPGNLRR
ncbi:hypothetical protein D3C84_1017210 [compost metagenome]